MTKLLLYRKNCVGIQHQYKQTGKENYTDYN